ncbi:hypothetical protein [Streptomyces sp. NRRL B-3648]|uniref:hypothetical protein n=1 Tax=Streptomyces sp. NRRL B-3648 TaxID=1519493 RepID=UPI0006AF4D2D|nr:hypothetical protein [Streptomyces sp. NRRL B-3648]KOX05206.1 hypothetical protein ADL04_06920 [Streptomyces sp. NRRL B-3648]
MAQHSIDEVHSQVADIKKQLESGGGIASREYIDKKFKDIKIDKEAKKKEEDKKDEPSQLEQWAKTIGFGLDEVVKTVQDFKVSQVASWSTLGAVVAGFLITNFFDKDAFITSMLEKRGYQRDERGIPRKRPRPDAAQVPITTIDVERVRNLQKESIALSKSLIQLTKDVRTAARQIA